MDDVEIKSLIDELLKKGDIKYYSSEGDLVDLATNTSDPCPPQDEDDYINYIKSVEHDFRNDANAILEKLELSHLHARHMAQ